MPRHPRPWKRGKRGWYTTINGQQVRLGDNEKAAWVRLREILAEREDLGPDPLTVDVVRSFLAWCGNNRKPKTRKFYGSYLDKWAASFDPLERVSRLRRADVLTWVERRYSESGQWNAIRALQRPFSWAQSRDLIHRNPLEKCPKPKPPSREVTLTQAQFETVLSEVKDINFCDVLTVMRACGCRPEEIRKVEAKHLGDRSFEFPGGFIAKVTEDRTIPLTDAAWDICQRRAAQFPEGPIFRNRRGPWHGHNFVGRCHRLSKKIGIHFTIYMVRHLFTVEALVNQVDVITLSKLLGHSSLAMIQKHYGQVQRRGDYMRAAVEKANGRGPG